LDDSQASQRRDTGGFVEGLRLETEGVEECIGAAEEPSSGLILPMSALNKCRVATSKSLSLHLRRHLRQLWTPQTPYFLSAL
jgi:hypothetical protein